MIEVNHFGKSPRSPMGIPKYPFTLPEQSYEKKYTLDSHPVYVKHCLMIYDNL